ncbi:MAG: DNA repair protein RecN [Bacteroidales bacterium]|nr:DNA repair protein RecN [Bacteroidales bacterium]
MLRSLHIENYVLIDSLDVEFPGSLSIITGQTGAGKSILLGALGLLSGAKGDASLIASGKDSCVVEGEFSMPDDSLIPMLEENEVECPGDGLLIIRRVLSVSGRSRCFVNDSPVTVGVLAKCAEKLIDIHSQHNNLLLSDKRWQLSVLDHFAGAAALASDCSAAWKKLQGLNARRAEISARLARLQEDRDYNQARYDRLASARLVSGEMETLEAEHKQLSHAEEIRSSLEGALEAFGGETSVSSSLRDAGRLLGKLAAYMPDAEELGSRIESARIELDDIRESLEAAAEKVDVSGDRLQAVEDRMGLLYELLRSYGCRTVDELIALREEYSAKLFDSSALEDELASLDGEIAAAKKSYADIAGRLSSARGKAAPDFGAAILGRLRFLELDRAAFEVQLVSCEEGPSGREGVMFSFSADGKRLQDVAKCASGGEMSRIMLSLKAEMARFAGMPTMIFDEIDTGVSGSAADAMGRMICEMGAHMQLLAITHLPQVAAKGDAHFVVEKTAGITGIRRVEGRERVMEIARLLSASTITPEAVANAEALLR